MTNLIIDNQTDLTIKTIKACLTEKISLKLSSRAHKVVNQSKNFITQSITENKLIYGVNTGFGKLANIKISAAQLEILQKNLLLSHAIGVGDPLSNETVKLILLLKIQSLAQGFSGIRPETLDLLIAFYNAEIYPYIPSQGSVGASGDLAPLAHMSLPLIGEGQVFFQNQLISAKAALKKIKRTALTLAPKEGLALINGTQVSTAITLSALFKLENIFNASMIAGLLSFIAAGANAKCFDHSIHKIRRQSGQIYIAKILMDLIKGCRYSLNSDQVQAPYSLRCMPQVFGSCLDQTHHAAKILMLEANAVTDNPLIFVEENKILFGGNFHAEPVAFAADNLALVFAELGTIAERRIALLMDPNFSGLPAFLARDPGLNSGLMVAQVSAAALASENKALAQPRSIDSIPTSANQEDHVSMATNAANRLLPMANHLAGIIAIELVAASQGLALATKSISLNKRLNKFLQLIHSIIKPSSKDCYIAEKVKDLTIAIITGKFNHGELT